MIPFSPPRIDQKTIDAVIEVLRSGWITTGPKTQQFEELIREYTACKSVVCLNSASAGLELALRWFGVGAGDEVILPAYTYAATANVIIHCGAKPVFVDVNESDFNISIEDIKKNITSATKVIIPVDIGGLPCDYSEINNLVKDENINNLFTPNSENQKILNRILVLSDAAHSVGAKYFSKQAGALTDISVFSFHAVKNLTTAEGGAICLNLSGDFCNESIRAELKTKSLHGQNKDARAKLQPGNWKYDIVEAGYKCNMTDIQAAIGAVEINRYEDMLNRRKEIFDIYSSILSRHPQMIIPTYKTENIETSYHVFLLRIKGVAEAQRDEIIAEIFKREVSVNVHFKPLPMMSYYKKLGYDIANYPTSYDNFSKEISLPVYYDLTNQQAEIVANTVIDAVNTICK